jgi:ABC-type multidrug transport system fused ATPase/permease subunit
VKNKSKLQNKQIPLNKIFSKITLYKTFLILEKTDQKKLTQLALIQISTGFLDLIGVVILGTLGALSIQGIEGQLAGNRVSLFLKFCHLQNLSFQTQVAILGIGAASFLLLKTAIAIYFTRRSFFFLARKSADLSSDLIAKHLAQNLLKMQDRTSQETLFIISDGVKNLMVGILATGVMLLSDMSLLVIISFGLFFIDPMMAVLVVFLFLGTGYLLYRLLQLRALEIGISAQELTVKNNLRILEVLNSYRESVVRNRREYYAAEVRGLRYDLGKIIAELNFQPYISKYVIESVFILGALTLAVFEFVTKNATHAVAVLTVFLAASSRITPAALRIQQSVLTIRNSSGAATSTFELIKDLNGTSGKLPISKNPDFLYEGFSPEITINELEFSYKKVSEFSIKKINLKILSGQSVAIVGPSGAGKTTLIDLILGVIKPDSGDIYISGVTPSEACVIWGGAIAYVPQDVKIIMGSIRDNIAMGYPRDLASNDLIWPAVRLSHLEGVVTSLPDGLDSDVGENGVKVSGGQRQRLGIARALFTKPKLLVLDEATSALDGLTEQGITDSLAALSGKTTVLVVAHRLSTARNADMVVYMENGEIVHMGKFEDVKIAVPNFELQANLMGL